MEWRSIILLVLLGFVLGFVVRSGLRLVVKVSLARRVSSDDHRRTRMDLEPGAGPAGPVTWTSGG